MSESVDRLRAMHSHGAANVVARMRAGERVAPEEVTALQKLETTIDLREQVERIREITTDEGPQADTRGGPPPSGQPVQAPAP